jgi:hypothetical protein
VREKIYQPALVDRDPNYRRHHSDRFAEQELSCREKHLMGKGEYPNHSSGRLEIWGPAEKGAATHRPQRLLRRPKAPGQHGPVQRPMLACLPGGTKEPRIHRF